MAKINSSDALDLITLSKAENKVGDYKWSALSETAFSNEHLGQWMLCDGRSCAGTGYATLTGSTTVPDATTDGTFIRQAKAGRALGSFEADDFKSHTHLQNAHSHGIQMYAQNVQNGSGVPQSIAQAPLGGVATTNSSTATNQNTGGAETRPKNIALNLYVKVGY